MFGMKFGDYIKKFVPSMKKLSELVDEELYLVKRSIYVKRDDSMIVDDYTKYSYEQVVQMIRDYISKNFNNEFDITDSIDFLTYTKTRVKDIDEHLSSDSRVYQHKPLICFISDDFDDHGYIVGYTSKDLQKVIDYMGSPKSGYSLYVFDGKFEGMKAKINSVGIDVYVIDPGYRIRHADGVTEFNVDGLDMKIKHVRRCV